MGEYLTILWEAATPSAKAVEWDSCMIIGEKGSASITETTIYRMTSDTWQAVLDDAGFAITDQTYLSVGDFFGASPIPGCTLTLGIYVSGVVNCRENMPLARVDVTTYETPIKPPVGFCSGQFVRYFQDKDLADFYKNFADGSVGTAFEIERDGNNDWTGRLIFDDGLSYDADNIDDPLDADSKITIDFRVNEGIRSLVDAMTRYDVNMVALSLANENTKKNYPDVLFGSQLRNISVMMNMIAGRDSLFIYNLPGDARATDVIQGLAPAQNWHQLRNFVGQREGFTPISALPASDDASLCDDMACGYMGMIASNHPHRQMTFAVPHMGIGDECDLVDRAYWKDGQIAAIMQNTRLEGNPYQITYGFTFGIGYANRINYVRCKGIISRNLVNGIHELFAAREVLMSYDGIQIYKDKIKAIFKNLIDQGIVDKFGYVNVPIEEDFLAENAAATTARLAYEIPSTEIGFYWYSSLEKIRITSVKNEA